MHHSACRRRTPSRSSSRLLLLHILVENQANFVDLLLTGTMLHGVGDARVHVLAEDRDVGFLEQGGGREDLPGDVDAVAVLLDHADDAVDLPPGSLERVEGLFACLLYTSDATDDLLCVDLGGR